MKKIFLILNIFIFSITTAQYMDKENSFSQEEINQSNGATIDNQVEDDGDPPPPTDPVPIDDYIPLLLLTGAGLIIGLHYRKRLQTK